MPNLYHDHANVSNVHAISFKYLLIFKKCAWIFFESENQVIHIPVPDCNCSCCFSDILRMDSEVEYSGDFVVIVAI